MNTRLLPGKTDTITKNKVKMQKRILNDTLQNLHKSFCAEYPSARCSYASFCKWKPFWIIDSKCDQRVTCYCKFHANMQYVMDRLKEHKIKSKQSMRELSEKFGIVMSQKSACTEIVRNVRKSRYSLNVRLISKENRCGYTHG